METIKKYFSENIVDVCVKLIIALLIVFIGFWIVRIVMKMFRKGRLYKKMDPSVRGFIDSALSIVLKALILVTAITYAGVPMTSVIAVIGSLGLALGLALQGGLSNIAGGILILINKPFQAGDYINVNEYEGVVKNISIFYTTIETYTGKKIVIPNGTVTGSVVVNNFANDKRRIDLVFSTSYSSDIDKVKKTLIGTAENNKKVLGDPAPSTVMTEHSDSAVKYSLRVWVKTEDFWEVQYQLIEDVKRAFDREGIEIPFPQIDVHNK